MKINVTILAATFASMVFCSVGLLSCKSSETLSTTKAEPAEYKQGLTLGCTLSTEAGEIPKEYSLFEIWEHLETYCIAWGQYMVSESDVIPGNAEGVNAYRRVFISTCRGDTILDILNSPGGLGLPRQMTSEEAHKLHALPYDSYSVRYDVPERTDVRVALGNMAIKAYHDVLIEVFTFSKNEELREHLLELNQFSVSLQDGSEWVSTGEELLEKMYASVPTLVEKIADIKMQNAEELIAEGVSRRDEWGSTDYGRAPALKEIWGGYAGCSGHEL